MTTVSSQGAAGRFGESTGCGAHSPATTFIVLDARCPIDRGGSVMRTSVSLAPPVPPTTITPPPDASPPGPDVSGEPGAVPPFGLREQLLDPFGVGHRADHRDVSGVDDDAAANPHQGDQVFRIVAEDDVARAVEKHRRPTDRVALRVGLQGAGQRRP